MDFAPPRSSSSHRRSMTLIMAAIIAALTMAMASSAQAAPNIAVAWGANGKGQLGDGTTTGPEKCGAEEPCSTNPVQVTGLSGVTAVASGGNENFGVPYSLALLESGTVMGWGRNEGEFGTGSKETTNDVPVATGFSGLKAVAAGGEHSLAVLSNGTVMASGRNDEGQLGNGTTAGGFGGTYVPVTVCAVGTPTEKERKEKGEEPGCPNGPYLEGVKAVAAGRLYSLALLENGTVVAWGANGIGELGNGTTGPGIDVPVVVSGLSGVVAIAAREEHSLALLSNGTVMAWGENRDGELGNGTTTNSDVPVAVSKLSGATAIAADRQSSLGLLSNGTVKAWGANESGQLGDGTSTGPEECGTPTSGTACSKTPVAVSNLVGVTAIAGNQEHNLALLSSGSVLAWGNNSVGELGDGTSTGPEPCGKFTHACSTKPAAVNTHGAQVGIEAGPDFSVAFGPPPPPTSKLPEVGRCVKVTTKKGAYKYGNCIVSAPGHKGSFEWMPGPGPQPKFEAEIGTPKLETVGKKKVGCTAGFLQGEWTGAKTATITLIELSGCGTATTKCATSIAGSSIKNQNPLEGALGLIVGGEKPLVGLDIKPKSPSTEVLSFICGQPTVEPPGEAWSIEGSVIGSIKPPDSMHTEFQLLYAASGGLQSYERFEGGLKDTLLVTRVIEGEPARGEQAGLTLKGSEKSFIVLTGEEPVEFKAK
jgi:alpha-tubulin suppressor-like RCC1 family protein